MARADRLKAGDPFISANNTNKAFEQANRLDSFQAGPGIDSQNDATGFQLRNNRRRPVLDGDSPFSSSSPYRRTLKKRTDTTRHKGEFELYGSSGVPLSRYRMPYLPVDADGDGDLTWGVMDADEFGSSGRRRLERMVSGSGERFQIFGFDDAATNLDSSNEYDICVRRDFSSSAQYVQWVSSSDFIDAIGAGLPRWDQVEDANTDVEMISDTDSTGIGVGDDLDIGTLSKRWQAVDIKARVRATLQALHDTGSGFTGGSVETHYAPTGTEVILYADGGDISVDAGSNVDIFAYDDVAIEGALNVIIKGLSAADPGVTDALFTQTATQLGGSGATKVLCVSP